MKTRLVLIVIVDLLNNESVEFLKYSRTARLAQQASAAVTLEYLTVIAGEAD